MGGRPVNWPWLNKLKQMRERGWEYVNSGMEKPSKDQNLRIERRPVERKRDEIVAPRVNIARQPVQSQKGVPVQPGDRVIAKDVMKEIDDDFERCMMELFRKQGIALHTVNESITQAQADAVRSMFGLERRCIGLDTREAKG